MGIGQNLVKWLMLIFNLLFWVSGIGLIIVGAVAQGHYKPYLSFLNSGYVSAPVLFICVGAIITLIAFFGCCGAAKESYCMLMTFAVLLGVIFIVEMAGGIAGYVERGKVSEYLEDNMRDGLERYNATTDRAVWDGMQSELKCCGVDSYDDWLSNATTPAGGLIGSVPLSCCKVKEAAFCDRNITNLGLNCADKDKTDHCPVYSVGCLPLVQTKLENNILAIGGFGIGVAFIQILGIVASCFLAKRVRRGYIYAK